MREMSLLLMSLLFLGCSKKEKSKTTQEAGLVKKAKSIVMIIAHKNFRDEEFKEPYDYLKGLGYKVDIASTDTTEAVGMLGMKVKPDLLISEIDTTKYDALVLVGGMGATVYWNDSLVHNLAKYFYASGKVVAAICLAPVTLARAGILKDKRATVFSSAKGELIKYGANYTGGDLEIENKLITASGPKVAKDFAIAIAKSLK